MSKISLQGAMTHIFMMVIIYAQYCLQCSLSCRNRDIKVQDGSLLEVAEELKLSS